jgi:hypothetical protein
MKKGRNAAEILGSDGEFVKVKLPEGRGQGRTIVSMFCHLSN